MSSTTPGQGAPNTAPPVLTPVAPAPTRGQQAARASWMAPLVVIIVNFVVKQAALPPSAERSLAVGFLSLALYVVGLGLAVFALTRVSSEGRLGILAPGLVGLIINALFLLIVTIAAVSAFNAARERRHQKQSLVQPVRYEESVA